MNDPKPEDVMPEGAVMEALELRAPHDTVCRYALALLRENRSQISVLKKLLDRCETQFAEKDAEIERLNLLCTLCPARGHSYAKGWNDAITEFADRIIRFYNALPGKTVGGSVEYHVKQVRDAMLKEGGSAQDE